MLVKGGPADWKYSGISMQCDKALKAINEAWGIVIDMIIYPTTTGMILGLCPANNRRRYFVTTSLIGWAQT